MLSLTLDELQAVYDHLIVKTHLVYATSDMVAPGKVIEVKETNYTHACWIFANEEEAHATARAANIPLLHLRNAPIKVPSEPMPIHPSPEELGFKTMLGWRVGQW